MSDYFMTDRERELEARRRECEAVQPCASPRGHLYDAFTGICLFCPATREAVQPPATPQEPAPSIDCPLCGEEVRQVSSATLSLALSQHVRWVCRLSSTPSPEGQTWQPIETADRSSAAINRRIWGVVNGETRLIAYGFSSHTKWLTWCLADQGVEDFDTCTPTHWQPYIVPAPPTPEGTQP